MSAARHTTNQAPLYIGMEWHTLIGEIKDTAALDFSTENIGIQNFSNVVCNVPTWKFLYNKGKYCYILLTERKTNLIDDWDLIK